MIKTRVVDLYSAYCQVLPLSLFIVPIQLRKLDYWNKADNFVTVVTATNDILDMPCCRRHHLGLCVFLRLRTQ
jgi:hypothetical protein